MAFYILKRHDGAIEIMHTDADPAAAVAKFHPIRQAELTNTIVETDPVVIPTDRTFRNAWIYNGSSVEINMPKAKIIHMDRIREIRDAELDKKDKDWMKAMGQKDQVLADQIEAERQALRDIPQTFDLTVARMPDELKVLWPSQLP